MLRIRQYTRGWRAAILLIGVAVVTGLACFCFAVQPVHAQGAEIDAAHQQADWQASYWNNMELAGTPALVRSERVLNYDWGTGSPAAAINADHFAARWVCTVQTEAGQYQFRTTSDDGIRIYLDDRLIINEWYDHAAQVHTAQLYLTAGHHTIRVDFFENEGVAVAQLYWYRTDDHDREWPDDGEWRGEYYNNRYLSGSPAFVRYDDEIDFNWGNGSPDSRIPDDNFSVRWERSLYLSEDDYRFVTYSDDGVQLYINGDCKIDAWYDAAVTRRIYETHLARGNYTIRLVYYEHTGAAQVKLTWSRISEVERPVGNIITCAPPQPYNYAWIKIYRRDGNEWVAMTPKGIGAINATGYLKIDGLPVDVSRYGGSGHPYCVELWVNGQMVNAVGNTDRGEAEFRVYADQDNYTPWSCPLR